MTKKILIIDDERDTVKMWKISLERNDYEVIAAYSGQEGLNKIMEIDINLILLDLIMPIMSGFRVLKLLKTNPQTKNIPVVIITCKTDTESLAKTQEWGAVDYLIKPFESQELLETVQKYL